GPLPCRYPVQTCQDHSATNYGGPLPCRYPVQTCQDPYATNYRGPLPCRYHDNCYDNYGYTDNYYYGGTYPCGNNHQTCQDPYAVNYRGSLPCRYQDNNHYNNVDVNITADDRDVDYGDSTRIRWDSDNADYCNASGGTNDWDDNDIGTSGTFYTGALRRDETFKIACYNNRDSANDSVTVRVDDNNDDNNN